MTEYITERTAGKIIADSFRIYAAHFVVFVLIFLLPVFPAILLSAAAAASGNEALVLTCDLLQTVIGVFTTGAITVAVSDVCLGNSPNLSRSYRMLAGVIWRYLGTYALSMLLICVGLILFVVPGIYAILLLLFALPASIIERRSAIDACKRSKMLGKGYYLRNFGVIILVTFAFLLCIIVLGVALGALTFAIDVDPDGFLFTMLAGLGGGILAPVFQIAAILLYYDMRVRKENFDGAALAQELMT